LQNEINEHRSFPRQSSHMVLHARLQLIMYAGYARSERMDSHHVARICRRLNKFVPVSISADKMIHR